MIVGCAECTNAIVASISKPFAIGCDTITRAAGGEGVADYQERKRQEKRTAKEAKQRRHRSPPQLNMPDAPKKRSGARRRNQTAVDMDLGLGMSNMHLSAPITRQPTNLSPFAMYPQSPPTAPQARRVPGRSHVVLPPSVSELDYVLGSQDLYPSFPRLAQNAHQRTAAPANSVASTSSGLFQHHSDEEDDFNTCITNN
jgi:hypothetical protein